MCLICDLIVSGSLSSGGIDFLEQPAPTGNTIVVQTEEALHETFKRIQQYHPSTY